MKETLCKLLNFVQCLIALASVIFLGLDVIFKLITIIDFKFTELDIFNSIILIFLFILLGLFSLISASSETEKPVKLFSYFNILTIGSILYFINIQLEIYIWVIAILFMVANLFNGIFYTTRDEYV